MTAVETGSEAIQDLTIALVRAGHGDVAMLVSAVVLRAEQYVAIARTQLARIAEGQAVMLSALEEIRGTGLKEWQQERPRLFAASEQVHADIHFYFICWDTIAKMLRLTERGGRFPRASATCGRHRAAIQRYRKARQHLEHFDERRNGPRAVPLLGAFSFPDRYEFGGDSWDVGSASLALIAEIVREWKDSLYEDCRSMVAGTTEE